VAIEKYSQNNQFNNPARAAGTKSKENSEDAAKKVSEVSEDLSRKIT